VKIMNDNEKKTFEEIQQLKEFGIAIKIME
jgi:hypothetical protein